MRLDGKRESDNVEDVRGSSGGGGIGLPIGGRGIGIGGVVVALLASWIFGVNPLAVLGLMGGDGGAPMQQAPQTAPSHPTDAQGQFVSKVLADTEDVWGAYFQRAGQTYQAPRLVLFRGRYPTGCGTGEAAMGPFYCPADRKVYIDLGFYDTLRDRLGAPGDFAQAYVIAHEVGHHLQNLMGTTDKLDQARGRVSQREANAMSVKLELQADCYAGVWSKLSQQASGWLDKGDIEEALNAAAQIGDDTLQKQARGTVVPESFTHGSSAQRVRWFKRGAEAGELQACDTFSSPTL